MTKTQFSLLAHQDIYEFTNFDLKTLKIDSAALMGNPLGDPSVRRHPVLVPKENAPAGGWPVVMVLAGFTGNGPNYFNLKTFESNLPQTLDDSMSRNEAPKGVYVFCDAMTYWGGSQFVNSAWTGRYEDFIAIETVTAVLESLPVSKEAGKWCVTGGSSGGYGALHLSSRHPNRFGICAAIAPDSFFEASLLPDIYSALPAIEKLGGVTGVKAELESGKLSKRKDFHSVMNAIGMAHCYSGSEFDREFPVPVDREIGVVRPEVWNEWKLHDPIVFLRDRAASARKIQRVFLDVGTRDQFHLQFGARQIRAVLSELGVALDYSEFEGTHFDIGDRRPMVWKWLKALWEQS